MPAEGLPPLELTLRLTALSRLANCSCLIRNGEIGLNEKARLVFVFYLPVAAQVDSLALQFDVPGLDREVQVMDLTLLEGSFYEYVFEEEFADLSACL